ncbi:hypothetical protein MKX01_005020 [Papaver californicum]|nr:hypothetical protein MKX01_005020 [Papaver californicum]
MNKAFKAKTELHKKALEFIEEVTANADQFQNQVLSEVLSRSANVEYLQRHGLNGHTDRKTFKKVIPIVNTYDDIKPDINRIIANGNDTNSSSAAILCGQPITKFFCSSGTSSGVRKRIPVTEDDINRRWFFRSLMMPVVSQYIPGLEKGKAMYIMIVKPEFKTPGGLALSTSTTGFYKCKQFQDQLLLKTDPYNNYTSPIETILCEDSNQSMYSQLLCGLYQNDLVFRVGASFGSSFTLVIRYLQEHWTHLCSDIRTGSVSDTRVKDPVVRHAVKKILVKPNPRLADFIETECKRSQSSSWEGILSRLWPNAKYIETIVTGTMSQYIPTIDFLSNGLPIVCATYLSSECYMGINLNPLCRLNEVSYTLIPTMAYYEFLPVLSDQYCNSNNNDKNSNALDEVQQEQELVDLVDVKLGQEYEIFITTYTGLYRYRVGDVLRVSGFKNSAPQFNFICRSNTILSIDSDKTNETELQNAVNKAADHLRKLNVSLVDYTSHADTSTIPGHYVLYWELQQYNNNNAAVPSIATSISPSVFEECCLIMEETLSSVYRGCRVYDKSIGPLEIKIVETGTFGKLLDYAVTQGAAVNQYKTPRSVKFGPITELLNSRVLSNYLSLKCPKFHPGT